MRAHRIANECGRNRAQLAERPSILRHGQTGTPFDVSSFGNQAQVQGKVIVVFKGAGSLLISCSSAGIEFGPTILAPFAHVILDGRPGTLVGHMDGLIIAKSLGAIGSEAAHVKLHGVPYTGPVLAQYFSPPPPPSSPPPVPLTLCTGADAVPLDLSGATLTSSNLAAVDGARYSNVATLRGRQIDMMVSTTNTYTLTCPSEACTVAPCPTPTCTASLQTHYGSIGFGRGATNQLHLTFKFLYQDDRTPAALPSFRFTFLDLLHLGGDVGFVTVGGHGALYLGYNVGDDLQTSHVMLGDTPAIKFRAKSSAISSRGPFTAQPTQLSNPQRASSFQVNLQNAQSFDVVVGTLYSSSSAGNQGSMILFAVRLLAFDARALPRRLAQPSQRSIVSLTAHVSGVSSG